jgi:hypothetical protein
MLANGLTLAKKNQELLEYIILEELKTTYKLPTKSKFKVNNWVKKDKKVKKIK